jgi:predicted Zn-dependent protease
MDRKHLRNRAANRVGPVGQSLRSAVALVITLTLALAPLASAARTLLRPGWNMFSAQQDIEVGQQVSKEAEQQLRMLNDRRVDNYLNNLGRRLAAKAPGEKYPYQFQVVNDRAINAFALPGGPVYINRGVIEAADNEAQLAGVMAHEISHVALRHGTNQASKASAAQMPLAILGGMLGSNSVGATLAQLGASFTVNSILLKYSRTAEQQADILGTQILYDTGYDARAMAQFFEKIQAQNQGGQPVEFFSNHPNPGNRIQSVNQEIDNLGGARGYNTDSREFDDTKRYVRSLPAPPAKGQPLQGSNEPRQNGTSGLRILIASYGSDTKSADVRQLLQSRVQNNQLNLQVNNSTMGGDPSRGQLKTLWIKYQWADRTYDVAVQENQRVSIPTQQQQREIGSQSGSQPEWPSDRFVSFQNSVLSINHPDNWQAYGQGDAATIAPRGGMVNDGNGNQALAYGVIVNIYEPQLERYNQQLQGPDYGQGAGQGSRQDSRALLMEATDQLVQELRLSNRNMRVVRSREDISVNGSDALSTYLSNDSPIGGRETNWLVTVQRPDGLMFLVFTAPDRDFQNYEGTFQQMLYSVRINQ